MTEPADFTATVARLRAERNELRRRLEEAEETLHAIRSGAVDGFLIEDGEGGERVYTLESADRPYRLLVDSMAQGALVLSEDGTILFANGRFSDLVGTAHVELAGRHLSDFILDTERPALAEAMEQAKLGRGITEVSLKRGADDTVPVGVALSPVPLGNAPTMCAVVTDLTEQRQHEELRRAQAALKDADRRKDEFLATLAHELRNPLAPVSSAVHILRLKAPAIPEVQWAQEVIERQVEQMTRLVDDLLDLSRVTRNQIILRRAPVELATIIRSAVETSTPAIDLAGHRLNVEVPPSAVILDVDQMRISQVLANLLNNAAKYTNRGGTITVRAGMHGDHVVIDVEDTGVGIPQELLPRVFDMFTQVDRSLERTQTGLGIGLTLSKRLMEMHGGTIVVRSEPGKGSTFTVRLPPAVVVLAGAPVQNAKPEVAIDDSSLRVLIVDDNVDSADSLSLALQIRGHHARAVYDGASALQVGASFRPDVILLDLGMPDLDGHETCRLIRKQSWGDDVRIVALTGWGQYEDRRKTGESGFDYHLVKPMEPPALANLLERISEGRPPSTPSAAAPQRTVAPAPPA
jgi:PAS domain S-box-containing protein